MSDGIYVALSGAVAQQRSLDVVANNVANANTTGFRADRVAFAESMSQAQGPTNQGAPNPLRQVGVVEIRYDHSEGTVQRTDNPFDLAISGDGWFTVETPRGERYTRAGSFVADRDGVLRTRDGHAVLNASGAHVTIPREVAGIEVSPDGTLRAGEDEIGRIQLVQFSDDRPLTKEGLNLFVAPPGQQPEPLENAQIMQGYLEGSNVNVVGGMNELIAAGRSFEAFQRIIQGYRDMDQRTARDLGDTR